MAAGRDFHAFYSAPHDEDFASVFHRRFRKAPPRLEKPTATPPHRLRSKAFPVDERVAPPFALELPLESLPSRVRRLLEASRSDR